MAADVPAELVADVEEAFLGYWPEDLMVIVRAPFEPGALEAYAYRDGGAHLPQGGGA